MHLSLFSALFSFESTFVGVEVSLHKEINRSNDYLRSKTILFMNPCSLHNMSFENQFTISNYSLKKRRFVLLCKTVIKNLPSSLPTIQII